MKREKISNGVYDILKNKLNLSTIENYHEDARLNEDLYLDSVMILQLILHLELDLGISIPDDMLVPKDFHTVGTLLDFLERRDKEERLG
ncbi:acyl carrier protein [Bacillus sp. THAF10]|uniref:petrobactin biosynthesis protein AsbD n=1 Tax=Bacillus sp. THAF10 TaxID=2587848 RepID=UPI001268C0B2|nr:petrobactin biosynthesis protein AsbD [Bacillus sp. THAF10]QFT89103.1 acyl carrier protein [Bacillus sp. THAF10]